MTRVLIVYGTTDGHTAKVAQFLADELRIGKIAADVADSAAANPDPRQYQAVIVAGSLQAKGYQRSIVRWVREHARELLDKPSAFLTVCLSVLQQEVSVKEDLARIQQGFFRETGWSPMVPKVVAGALLYTRYGWLKRMAMRYIAKKAGGDTDVRRDYEYTDWEDLRRFARSFAAMCRATWDRPAA